MEWLVQVLIDGGAQKVVERELVSSMGRSQQGDGASLLMDYDQEWMGESEGWGGDKLRVGDDGGERKERKGENVQ